MKTSDRGPAFSLVEVVLALGLLSVVILALSLLSLSIIRSGTESGDRTTAAAVAESLLSQTLQKAKNDTNFWTQNLHAPYLEASATIGGQKYDYVITAETVRDTSGTPLGSELAQNVLKRVTISLTWFDTRSKDRQGYGKLSYELTRIVVEEKF